MRSTLVVPAVLALLTAACPRVAMAQATFDDVAGNTHEDSIIAVSEAGVVAGFPDGTFRPGSGITRGQMASLLTAALDLRPGDPSVFSDAAGTTHAEGIGALAAGGVVGGYPDGTFRPGAQVTRGQMATFLSNGFDLPADGTLRFVDVAGTTHGETISALASAGVSGGVSPGRYRPDLVVTRGQMATFLARALDLSERVEPPQQVAERSPDLDVAVGLEQVATMGSPVAGAVAPDGTLHLADRSGTVHALTDDGLGPAVVDVSEETTTDGERGLLGIAFGEDELYLSYTDSSGDTVLAGVPVGDDGGLVADARRIIYTLDQPFSNHNGGHVVVGPDGLVYLGLGDGGGSGDPLGSAQDLTTPLGALLRIDPRAGDPYRIPSGNPFVDVEDAAPEIFAHGLRNPWRFSFDPDTDELWIADVGQGSREEVNRVTHDRARGANFGWNRMEGTLEFAGSEPEGHVRPVHEYATHGSGGCAVTGGHVYTGRAVPQLRGAYLYADLCNGEVRGLVVDSAGEVRQSSGLGIDGGRVVSFVEDADHELYVLDLDGRVSRIVPA